MGGRALQQQTRGVSGSSGQKSSRQSRVAKGPLTSDQREEAIKLMADMFELVLPEKVAEEIVRRDVRLTYDPTTLCFLIV